MLWKCKSPFHIYQIHELFLGKSREILRGEVHDRITQEAKDFLYGKAKLYLEDEHSYFPLCGFEGASLFILSRNLLPPCYENPS